MVDSNVLNYISRYYKFYPLTELKRKILSQGYSEEDFNGSIELLGIKNSPIQESSKYKWMKTAGIIGIIFLLLSLILVIWLYFSFPTEFTTRLVAQTMLTSTSDQINSVYYVLSAILIGVILLIFFFYGFVVMGRKTGTKTLKICSWINITVMVLISFTLVGFVIYNYINTPATNPDISNYLSNLPPPIVEPINNGFFESSQMILIFLVATLLFMIFSSVSLILIGQKVKFIKIAGILKIVYTLMVVGGLGFFIYNITKNEEFAISLAFALISLSGETIFKILLPYIILAIISGVVILIVLLLLSLGLLNASKRYESSNP